MANSNLCLAMLASLSQRALAAVVDAGALSKADIAVIKGLRAGGGPAAHSRLVTAVRKHFAERDREIALDNQVVRKAIELYAQKHVQEVMPMPTLVERNVAKAADTQRALREAIAEYQATHPGCNRQDAIDKILLSPAVGDLVKAERRLTELQKLGGGSLPTPRPGTMHRTHNDAAPVLGRTGYDASVHDSAPRNSDASENPIIREHRQVLDDIKSGKLLWNDPKVQALVALERKQVFEKNY